MNDTANSAAVKSVARSLDILELLTTHPDGLTLSEICRQLPLPKSSTLGLLRTLTDRKYLTNGHRERTYRLGPRLLQLGSAYLHGIDLISEGQSVVRAVSRRCDETVHLATLEGRDVLYVAKEEGTSTIRMVSAVGKRFAAHGTGVGKMLLSALSDEDFCTLFPSDLPPQQVTATTVAHVAALRVELARTRARGYALDHEESTIGLCCVAAPVYDANAHMVAAMSISVPTHRFTPDRQPELLNLVQEGARQLSERLGYLGR